MNNTHARFRLLIGSVAALSTALATAGCNNKPSHPDEKSAVTNSLNGNNLGSVSVSQDQEKGVITLTGNVTSEDQKTQAANVAKQAAPDYTIADELGVRPPEASARQAALRPTWTAPLRITSRRPWKVTKTSMTKASTTRQKMGPLF